MVGQVINSRGTEAALAHTPQHPFAHPPTDPTPRARARTLACRRGSHATKTSVRAAWGAMRTQ